MISLRTVLLNAATCLVLSGTQVLAQSVIILDNAAAPSAGVQGGWIPPIAEAGAQAVATRQAPVTLFQTEINKAQTVFVGIARNGAFQTYRTDVAPITVTFRNGILIATRGLGADLMTSDVTSLEAALARRAAGQVSYRMEFLNGEAQTDFVDVSCTLSGASSITANCATADGMTFTNQFVVGRNGRVAAGRQWVGPLIGYVRFEHLKQ